MPEPTDRLPPRVTMPLLSLVSAEALEADYAAAARRRAASGGDPEQGRATGRGRRAAVVVTAAAVGVFGVLLTTAAVQTSREADVRDAGRAGLIARVEDQREVVAAQQDRLASLRSRITGTEVAAAEQVRGFAAETARLRRLQVATGFVAVDGEGVRATLDQAPDAAPTARLRDTDVALLVNALWSAGAEAVAVNGQRLTALSAVRTSGQAVEVNGVGIAPPFTVLAVGDRSTLQARFYETSSGLAFSDLAAQYDFDFEIENAAELSLPSAPVRLQRLRSAVPETGTDPDAREGVVP